MSETRCCRSCGYELPLHRFRRVAGCADVRRRTCRSCESRQRTRRWFLSEGRPVPARYHEPQLELGLVLRTLEHETTERSEGLSRA